MSDEVALSFPLGSRFWMKIDSNSKGDLKLHLDGGKLTCKKTGKEINVWAGIDTLKDHSKFSFKFGANYWGNLWDICTRISSSPADDCKLCFSEKIVRRFGNFFIGGYHC